MESIRLKARAKINLGLDVLGKRDNGYHDVRMVMQTIGIYDRIIMTKIPEDEICIVSNLAFLPVNENNLIYKAVKMIKDMYKISSGIKVELNKFIPVAAGMAGGSTDAASALYGMNRLFKLGLSTEKMMELGVGIGADVPYCVMRGTALAEGIGEKLTRLKPVPHMWILIAKPPINVSTKLVYESLDISGVKVHPDIDGIIEAINAQDVRLIAARMGNVLEGVTIPMYPVIEKIKQDMLENGAVNAMMSGSGPTVFGIFPDEAMALRCQSYLKAKGDARQVYITETFSSSTGI
ncbi:MAG: 4-(cytidine 5'-diphospho)-2-C-methyl-D-erythritol kinase [Eubacteriales bacterium]|nr:4-(cytidine 5'-diphospho)-2-C-methyl-D-erythritol kinase [Eubacteriales bacterium]